MIKGISYGIRNSPTQKIFWERFIFGAQYVAELPSYALIDFFSISYYYFLALLPLFSLMPHEKEEKWFLNV